MKNKAFTLIELLVVVLIIGILAAIALPQYLLAVEKSSAAGMQILVQNIKNAVAVCQLVKGGGLCTIDDFDITITGKNGAVITQANVSKNNQSPTMLNGKYGISYSSNLIFITRTPYAGKWFIDLIIDPSKGADNCRVRNHSGSPDGAKLLRSLGYEVPEVEGWRHGSSC
jgi:prepilin-type N-terminal cleavage/methylation domain-containing protein